jgi:signal transduction histidine kinase
LGILFNFLDNFDSSSYYYSKAAELAKSKQFYELYVRNIINYSNIFTQQGDFAESIAMLTEAQQMSDEMKNSELDAMLASAMATIYYSLGDIKQMHKYYRKAISHYKVTQNQSVLATLYINIAESFSSLSNNYDSAVYYFDQALAISNERNRANILNVIDITKGNLHYDAGRYDSAEVRYLKAIQNPLAEKHLRRKTALHVNLANVYRQTKSYDKAMKYYFIGERFADSLNLVEYHMNALHGMILIDSALGDFEQAFNRNRRYQRLKDALNKDESINDLKAMEVERALELQKLRNELLLTENNLQQNQLRNQQILGVLILLAFISSLIFTVVQIRNSKKIRLLNKLLNRNILELDQQKSALEKANQAKDKFFAILSHDLRGPSATLRTGLGMLNNEWSEFTEEERINLIQQLDNMADNTHSLLEDLLEWSRLQQGMMKVVESKFRLLDVVEEIKLLFFMAFTQKEQVFKLEIKQETVLNTDYQMLKQILHNLVANAIKFTPRGGTISIEAQDTSSELIICVKDSGIGIPPEKLNRLFELDADFGRPGTEGEKSSGMGLILCNDYATLLGASLKVESEPEKGSTFCIQFSKNS